MRAIVELRLFRLFVLASLASSGAGCALFFEDQLTGAGGSGGGGGASTSSTGGSSSVSAGGGGGGGGGEGGSLPECPGVQREGASWLATYAQTQISGFDRGPVNARMSFVGTAEGGARCGLEGLPSGPRLFYGELPTIDGENPAITDLGDATDAEVVLSSGGGSNNVWVVWRRGDLLCVNRQSSSSSLTVTSANPCGTNPRLHCTASSAISDLHAASTAVPIIGFRAAEDGQLDCVAPAGQRGYTTGPVLLLATNQANQVQVYSGDPMLSQVRSSGTGLISAEARVVGWCPAGSNVGAYNCTQGTYFQAFTSPTAFSFGSVEAIGTTYALLSPGPGIHPHDWGYAFTTADGAQRVLQWGTETNLSAGLTIPYETHANADPAGRETRVLGSGSIGNGGIVMLTGELASAIDGAGACPASAGTCAFVMRANLGAVSGGVVAHPVGANASAGRAWATHARYGDSSVFFAGGYSDAPLAFGNLEGFDPGNGKAAFIARGAF